jgi:hypothetical protein
MIPWGKFIMHDWHGLFHPINEGLKLEKFGKVLIFFNFDDVTIKEQ